MIKSTVKVLFAVACAYAGVAHADLEAVCPVQKSIKDRKGIGALVQYKNNQVQRSGGVGSQLTGFLRRPTIIATQGRNPFKSSRATIYNSQGRKICSSSTRQGCASTRGECLGRYKFGCSTSKFRRATQRGGAFVKVSKTLCVAVPNAGKCYNVKVRDLCDGRQL